MRTTEQYLDLNGDDGDGILSLREMGGVVGALKNLRLGASEVVEQFLLQTETMLGCCSVPMGGTNVRILCP